MKPKTKANGNCRTSQEGSVTKNSQTVRKPKKIKKRTLLRSQARLI